MRGKCVDLFCHLACTANATSAACSNKTDLGTRGCVAGHGRGVTNVLMVTTTMRVIHGLRTHTVNTLPTRRASGARRTFMDTPRTFGHELRLALYLWYARPAFIMGLSIRPPPNDANHGVRCWTQPS